jgi:glycosyltransferase involved in cell wall biosynthesis
MQLMDTNSTSQASSPAADQSEILLYVLHSGQLFGTERMAISTLKQLGQSFNSLLLAPPGGAVAYAQKNQIKSQSFSGHWQLIRQMLEAFSGQRRVTLVATGISHSLTGIILATLLGIELRHLHIVHGGTDERLSYGRKKWLRWFRLDFIAVSQFVRQRLIAHQVPATQITVIENFLTEQDMPRRAGFTTAVANAIVVSRLDPIKRVGLLLDALQSERGLQQFKVDVYGSGWQEQELRKHAIQHRLNVRFAGFSSQIPGLLAEADLLIHTCPEEPFGLVILEAMTAGIPVLVPDSGGPSDFICDGENGFVYRANDAAHLAARLQEIKAMPAQRINLIVAAARLTLSQRFSATQRIEDYRRIFSKPSPTINNGEIA